MRLLLLKFNTVPLITVFIRQALYESGLRLDGRGISDYRDATIELSRTETTCSSEVHLGIA